MSSSTTPSAFGVAYDVGSDGRLRQEVVLKAAGGASSPDPSAPALQAGEAHIGQVGGEAALLEVTLTLDTSIYADGDVLADTQVVSNALRVVNGTALLESLVVLDEDDLGVGFDLLFFDANVSLGTENAVPSITDANMRSFLGRITISAGDYTDWGGVRTATMRSIGLLLKAATDTRDVYLAAVTRGGTPTYTASGIRLRLGVLQN